jgi:hypothetical protein
MGKKIKSDIAGTNPMGYYSYKKLSYTIWGVKIFEFFK